MKIIAQVASIPKRVETLKLTVESLLPQVDMLFVALNNYREAPKFLSNDKIVWSLMDNKWGDAAKFYDVDQRNGYILTCDDDLIYPDGYAEYMVNGVKKHGGIVSLLGKVYPRPVTSFRGGYSAIYRVLNPVREDHVVDLGGTGAMCFHTDEFKVHMDMFEKPNMADIWVAKAAAEQGVKITVLKHPKRYVKHVKYNRSIWHTTIKENGYQTAVLNTFLK